MCGSGVAGHGGKIVNQALIRYDYSLPDGRLFSGTAETNEVIVQAIAAPAPRLQKSASQREVEVGSRVAFAVEVSNPTPLVFRNLVLIDRAPLGLQWVPGTVSVGGESRTAASPDAGIPLGSLSPGQSVLVKFQALAAFDPPDSSAENEAELRFEFVFPNGRTGTGTARSNRVIVAIVEQEE